MKCRFSRDFITRERINIGLHYSGNVFRKWRDTLNDWMGWLYLRTLSDCVAHSLERYQFSGWEICQFFQQADSWRLCISSKAMRGPWTNVPDGAFVAFIDERLLACPPLLVKVSLYKTRHGSCYSHNDSSANVLSRHTGKTNISLSSLL